LGVDLELATTARGIASLEPLVPTYNPVMGWSAAILAMIAGFALFPAVQRLAAARSDRGRRIWLLGGALTVSVGFWGAQNLALLGFSLPTEYRLASGVGFLALLPALAGGAGALYLLSRQPRRANAVPLAAVSLALGTSGMNNSLIAAVHGDLIQQYDATAA
jgi:NO-binding membrane sensor protein with MHYT domain